jgi:two-component system, OmpR family, sensor histidine kinase KdpD
MAELVPAPRNLVIAYLQDHPRAIRVLRTAQQRAHALGGKWCAVYIETPQTLAADDGGQERMLHLLTLAEQMGGEKTHIPAQTLEAGVTSLLEAQKSRLALFVLGSIEPALRLTALRRKPWQKIQHIAASYGPVEIVPLAAPNYHKSLSDTLNIRRIRPLSILYALPAVGVAAGCAFMLQWLLPPALFRINIQNVGLLFMIACAFVAGRYGLFPGLVASIASFFTVNYFFTDPYYNLELLSITDIINMMLFLSAAVLISVFTSRNRLYAENAARRERSAQALFALYRLASTATSRDQVLEKLQRKLSRMLEMDVAFFLPPALNPKAIMPASPADLMLEAPDWAALDTCWKEIKTTGLAAPFNPGSRWRFEPMVAPDGEVGVIGVRPKKHTAIDAWFGHLLTAIADQTAAVIGRIELEQSMEMTRIREEREKLRSMLLSSVSHDLKTPLAGIIGALGVFKSLKTRLTQARLDELLDTALEEAMRLDSFITNILDMTRLESGEIEMKPRWQDVPSFLQNVTRSLQHRLKKRQLVVQKPPGEIEVYMDGMMTEQVVQNLLDNACKYTPAGTRIEVGCNADPLNGFSLSVRDFGPGIPIDKLEIIFDKYARLQKKDSQAAGTGLGLAICRAVMNAQGGSVTAQNHPDGGAVFTLHLPQWRKMEHGEYAA